MSICRFTTSKYFFVEINYLQNLQTFEIYSVHKTLKEFFVLLCKIRVCNWPFSASLRNTISKNLSFTKFQNLYCSQTFERILCTLCVCVRACVRARARFYISLL